MTPDRGDHHAYPDELGPDPSEPSDYDVRIAPAPIDITRQVGSADELRKRDDVKRSAGDRRESHEAAAAETVSRSTRDPRSFHRADRAGEPAIIPARSAGAYPTAPLARAGVDPYRLGCLAACLASAGMVVAGLTWAIGAAIGATR